MESVAFNERVKQIAKKADLRQGNIAGNGNIPLQGKNPSETNTGRLQGIADANRRLQEQYKAVLAGYSENRRRAGNLRVEIAKGSRDGVDLLTLFEKSVKCIECMTGDTAFYKSVMQNVKGK